MNRIIQVLITLIFIQSCTSMKTVTTINKYDTGLRYYMPQKDLIIKVKTQESLVNDKVVIESVTITTSESYPDVEQVFMLKHRTNLVATNDMNIVITPSGLLTSAKSKYDSSIGEALVAVAQSEGVINGNNLLNLEISHEIKSNCANNREYIFNYKFNDGILIDDIACNLGVKVKPLYTSNKITGYELKNGKKNYSGIFYRQDLPYLVIVSNSIECNSCKKCVKCDAKLKTCNVCKSCIDCSETSALFHVSKLVTSPTMSKTHYMPISKTIFANNNSEFGFNNGVITSVKINTEGDITAFLTYPAKVLKAYFSAIGEIINIKNDNKISESTNIQNTIQLELLKIKLNQCLDAISRNDRDLIVSLGCSSN